MIQAIADGRRVEAMQFEQHYLVANRAASFCLEAGLPSREKLKEVEARKRRASTIGAGGADGAGRAEQRDDPSP